MTPRHSAIGRLAAIKPLDLFWKRALLFGIPTAALLALSAFPERFRAEATLTPADPSTLGLSDTLGQLGALNSVFGKQADVEVALRIGNSIYTRDKVIDKLGLQKRLGMERIELHRWMENQVTIRSLRGGIILVQMDSTDQVLAREIVGAFNEATRYELAQITLRQTKYKRDVLEKLVADAGLRLSKAQTAFDAFRLANGYADPGRTVDAISAKIPSLRAAIEDTDRRIAAASRLFTADNITIVQLQAERDALQAQLREALDRRPTSQTGTVGEAVDVSTRLFDLERELSLAKSLYTNYLRYLQGTTVEELTSTANIRLLEQPYVSTERQYRWSFVSAAIALLLLWMAIEFYRLRPPVGAQVTVGKGQERGGEQEVA